MRQARKMLTFLASYAPTIPDELFLIAAVLPYPGERMLDLAVVWPGDEKRGQRALQPLRRFLRPFEDTIRINAYLDEQRAGTGTPADGEYSSHRRSGHVQELTQDLIDVIVEYASSAPSEASGITMIYWHGPWCSGSHDNALDFDELALNIGFIPTGRKRTNVVELRHGSSNSLRHSSLCPRVPSMLMASKTKVSLECAQLMATTTNV
jgi:hypothetical protein